MHQIENNLIVTIPDDDDWNKISSRKMIYKHTHTYTKSHCIIIEFIAKSSNAFLATRNIKYIIILFIYNQATVFHWF